MKRTVRRGPHASHRRPDVRTRSGSSTVLPLRRIRRDSSTSSISGISGYPPTFRKASALMKIA